MSSLNRALTIALGLLALGLGLAASVAHAGNIECWKDKNGMRECGNSVPPEYSQERIEVLDDNGNVVEVRPAAKTKAQLAEEARKAKEEAKRKAKAAEQARQDTILMDTFGSVDDIKFARDQKLQAIEGIIKITKGAVDVLREKLEGLQTRAANIERAGHEPPKSLLGQMADTKRQIADKQSFVDAKHREQDAIRREYAADIKRFRELTSGKAAAVTPPGSGTGAGPATAGPTH